jgi:hypothetical protein
MDGVAEIRIRFSRDEAASAACKLSLRCALCGRKAVKGH